MRPRTLVIIPAAGSGTRFGGELPKQYLLLGGRTILDHTIDRFLGSDLVDEIVVAVSPDRLQPARERVRFVAGGASRQESVTNALAARDGFELVAAQTPQCFRASVLRDVLDRAARNGDSGTDEAGLAARYGFPVKVLPGDVRNFKITTPADLARAATQVSREAP